ncbi:site-2 protease family protein [Gorillibacterium sp. sgz5001074]|uniref:site-2 protease family protein n=1 Tax=Gorillibacterium sp. sgz5001074 TaxID=3446695 RepID=UPI003F664C6A
MTNLFGFPLDELPFLFLVVVIAFTLHEFAHAFTADRFGDPTPRSMGRVTLNPRPHMDVLGVIMIFLAGFGWARPVLVNTSFFKKRRLMSIIVSLVGPLSNLLLALIGVLAAFLLHQMHVYDGLSHGAELAIVTFLRLHITINLVLFLFNLLPLPPLDGYRILYDFLPASARAKLQGVEQWAVFIFLLLVFIRPLNAVTIGPYLGLSNDILISMNDLFTGIFGDHGQLFRIFR